MADCMLSIGYALNSFSPILVAVLVLIGVGLVLALIVAGVKYAVGNVSLDLQQSLLGALVTVSLLLAAQLTAGGYILRFYLNVVADTLDGADGPSSFPEFELKELMLTGLKGLGLYVVYVLPVITLPLLPLGMLAMGRTNDARGYNLVWAVRSA